MKNAENAFERAAAMLEDARRSGSRESLIGVFNWLNEACTASISSVKAPIIAINSDIQPTNAEGFRRYAPSFEARIDPGTGHLLMWDAPDEFSRLL
jgi:pimeloyl-ACP methyl ester carboxylesterase